jgi:hypothetical protein
VGKLALTTGKNQKRKVATTEQAGFLLVLTLPLLGFTSSTSLCYVELNVSEYSLANKKQKRKVATTEQTGF